MRHANLYLRKEGKASGKCVTCCAGDWCARRCADELTPRHGCDDCLQVTLSCAVSRSFSDDAYDDDADGGLVVRDMCLQGAVWDTDNNCFKDTT